MFSVGVANYFYSDVEWGYFEATVYRFP